MGRPFLLGTLAVLVAVIATCCGGSSSTAHETSTLNPFPHGEGQAAQIASIKAARWSGTKRGTQPRVHAWGSKGCMTEPGNVGDQFH